MRDEDIVKVIRAGENKSPEVAAYEKEVVAQHKKICGPGP